MGGYTILDYITNMVIQRAVYDYRHFYDDPFSNIRAGFYSKPELIRLFKEQGMSKKEALSAWRNSDATLWDAYKFTDGRAVLKPEYEGIVTKATENRAATTVKQRAALINGVTPTNDTCIAKGNFILSLVFIMRNFLIRQLEHLFAGGRFDNVVRKKVENVEYEHRGSKTYAKRKNGW
jgi:hypothetical protein